MTDVWLLQNELTSDVIGVFTSRDKAIEATSHYISSVNSKESVSVNMRSIRLDKIIQEFK